MNRMFQNAKAFNGDITMWDVSSVSNMENMFRDATDFNQKLCGAKWVRRLNPKPNSNSNPEILITLTLNPNPNPTPNP